MAKFQMTAKQKLKHEKAFEFYAETDAEGKRRSNAAIAGMVGVSASAVAYWKRRDNWDGKLLASLDQDLDEADLTNRNIKKLLRESLLRHIKSLNNVIEYSKNDDNKVVAIKAFVHICKELDCLTPDTGAADLTPPASFKDDLIHAPAQADREGAAGAGAPADGAGRGAGASPSALPAAPVSSADDDHPVAHAGLDQPVSDDLDHVLTRAGL